MKINLKYVIFTLVIWAVIFFVLNFASGFVSGNTYVHLEAVNAKLAKTTYGYFAPDQHKKILFPGLEPYTVTIDAYGFRSTGSEVDILSEEGKRARKILCVGDSITFGLFVDDEASYPYQIQSVFKEYGHGLDTVILNAGVGSSTVTDCLYYLKNKGLELYPDVVIMNFCPNDLPEMKREIPLYEKMIEENIFSVFKTIKLMNFLRMFRSFEVQYKYKRYLKKIKNERVKQILEDQSKDIEDILYVAEYNEGSVVKDPFNKKIAGQWDEYLGYLDEIIKLLNEKKIRFIYIIYPDILTVFEKTKGYYQDILVEFLTERKIEYLDLRPGFSRAKDQYLNFYNNPPRDFHLSANGNKLVAAKLLNVLR
ncbi:MAG: SGNH/GDSL hydrolase family protein [Candidatus Omnitrophota bacterium]